MRTLWPFTANFLYFACLAIVLPFLILYYQGLGFSGPQIGLLTGLLPLLTLVSGPLWTNLADRTGRHRLVLCGIILVGALTLAALPLLTSFWAVLPAIAVLSLCFIPITAFIDSATLAMLPGRQELYGRVRLGGTFGYALSGWLGGELIDRYGLHFGLWLGALILGLTLVTALFLEFGSPHAEAAPSGSVRPLLRDRSWLPFLALAFAGGLATLIGTDYLFADMAQLGAQKSIMGLALTFGTISEAPVLFFGDRLLTRFRAYPLFLASMLLNALRLLLFGVAATPNAVLVVQLVCGMAFPLMWLAGVTYAHEHAPAGLAATAQGLFGAMIYGIGSAVAGFMGGPLFAWLGGRGTYGVFGVIVLAILAGVMLAQRRQPAPVDTPGA